MKKIILALLTASIIISSCDILDKYPHDAVSRDSVSEEDLELLYTGLYCYSQYKPGFEGYFQNDMTGGLLPWRRFRMAGRSVMDQGLFPAYQRLDPSSLYRILCPALSDKQLHRSCRESSSE